MQHSADSSHANLGAMPTALPSEQPPVDPTTVRRAKAEIQGLAQEIAQLVRSEIAPAEFYEALLTRVVSALAAEGGAVWVRGDDGQLEQAFEIRPGQDHFSAAEAQSRHTRLLQGVLASGREALVPPQSTGASEAGNPTPHLLILGVMKNDQGPQGVVEVFGRSDTRPSTQRGYLRFVAQMCELAGDYLKGQRLRQFEDRQSLWHQAETFADQVHRYLSAEQVAFTLANEGRLLVGCDRVAVAVRRGRNFQVMAISGQDTFDGRSNLVTALTKLIRVAVATGEPVWYRGDASNLPPQLEAALQKYLDLAHSRTLAIVPLTRSGNPADRHRAPEVIGALVVEQLVDASPNTAIATRTELAARHGAVALGNALEHEQIFLLPLWRAVGKWRWLMSAARLPKLAAVLVGLLVLGLALALVPADFEVQARGTLQPVVRQKVFAPIDGVVVDVRARHGMAVAQDDVLVALRNTELDLEIADLAGRRAATSKQMQSLRRAMLGENRLSVDEQNRLSGQLVQLEKTWESLDRQHALCLKKRALLKVASPIQGQVITWQAEQRLARRPVRQGQVLLTVADPAGPWRLEVDLPEDRTGHVAKAAQQQKRPLPVEFMLATEPGHAYRGQVEQIDGVAEVRNGVGNSVRVNVAIDKRKLGSLRPGAAVTTKIYCGKRSLGYVWLHDLVAFIQAKVLFYF